VAAFPGRAAPFWSDSSAVPPWAAKLRVPWSLPRVMPTRRPGAAPTPAQDDQDRAAVGVTRGRPGRRLSVSPRPPGPTHPRRVMPDHSSRGDHEAKTLVADGSGDGFLTAGPTVRFARGGNQDDRGLCWWVHYHAGREANMTAPLGRQRWPERGQLEDRGRRRPEDAAAPGRPASSTSAGAVDPGQLGCSRGESTSGWNGSSRGSRSSGWRSWWWVRSWPWGRPRSGFAAATAGPPGVAARRTSGRTRPSASATDLESAALG
jgi:hypothetical protein